MTGQFSSTGRQARALLGKMSRQSSAAAGFTLIEVVLALTIFALLGTILYGAFALSHSALAKSQSGAERSQAQRATADLLGSYIRSAYPYRNSPQEQTVYFDGESDSLTFVSAYSHGMGGRGLAKIEISANEEDSGRVSLNLQESTPVRMAGDDGAGGQSLRVGLKHRISNWRLDYLDPQGETETWQERWDGQERRMLPRAVRFTFLDEAGREVRWVFPIMMVVLAP